MPLDKEEVYIEKIFCIMRYTFFYSFNNFYTKKE